ncbi:MAG TPA: hypothetical protein VF528_20935 [Pyrinomonadaceae bacterium]
MNVDFHSIRALDGRQDVGFEEFCCQIARRYKDVPSGSTFRRYRGAGGDGGVECLWILPTGEEWGWQAKYFFKLDKKQLDESVQTALAIHPKLTRYIICLPYDLTGPTGRKNSKGQPLQSETERFDSYVEEWQALAANQGRHIEFIRLDKSHLLDELLSFDPDHGRLRFWFDVNYFGTQWFEGHLAETIKAAKPRYTPQLTVDVPVAASFEALGRTTVWQQSIEQLAGKVGTAVETWSISLTQPDLGASVPDFPSAARNDGEALIPRLESIKRSLDEFAKNDPQVNLLEQLKQLVSEARELATRCLSVVTAALEAEHGVGMSNSEGFRQFMSEYNVSFPARHVDAAREVLDNLNNVSSWINSPQALLTTSEAMLLLGDAGVGKTHSICDIALDRQKRGLCSLVLLGEQFTSIEPWEQIRILLGLSANTSRDELLGALDAAGESTGKPCIIFIDALNETRPRSLWYNNLARMIEVVSRYRWLRLCVSCRSTYRDECIAPNVSIPEVEHTGFAGVEFEASAEFFRFYGLEAPSMPLMQPEFSNPLFLRLVCESLKDSNLRRLPDGMTGLSAVIEHLLASKNAKLAQRLDYNPKEQRVQRALGIIADALSQARTSRLRWSEAKQLIDSEWPAQQSSQSVFENLIREGLLSEDRVVTDLRGRKGTQDIVRFGFERLGDHILAWKHIEAIGGQSVQVAFAPGGSLNFTIADENAIRSNKGLLEALAIQTPEAHGIELTEVAGEASTDPQIALAVINSLVWRAHDSITLKTAAIVRKGLTRAVTLYPTLEALLALSTREANPLNALWFHQLLASISMPDRDSVWLPFLYRSYEQNGSLDRLLRWALDADLTAVSDQVAELWAMSLCWCTAAADRRVRDHATKAAVRVLDDHTRVCPNLMRRFANIDDEYVVERCLAIVYGSLIRSETDITIKATAKVVYESYFANDRLPANAMVRDYARLILELAAQRDLLPGGVTPDQFRPPYKSEWPLQWQDEGLQVRYANTYDQFPRLYQSCMEDDFAIYTVESALRGYDRSEFKKARSWIFQHVLDMGYTTERFANYDRYIMSKYGAGRGKPEWAERIGKKYQWIALYRLMARVADHVPKESDFPEEPPSIPELQGQGERNIDPTILFKREYPDKTPAWWLPIQYDFARTQDLSDDEWLDALTDFPDSSPMLRVVDPYEGKNWVVLSTNTSWSSKGNDSNGKERDYRYVSLRARSFIVRRVDERKAWEWFRRAKFREVHRFDAFNLHEGFLGEYSWALPFSQFFEQNSEARQDSQFPCVLTPTAHWVNCDFEFDAYQENGAINVLVPAKVFFDHENLRWNGLGGYALSTGKVSFLYPRLTETGPSALLVDVEYLNQFLAEHDAVLIWGAASEKHCMRGFLGTHNLGYSEYSRAHALIDGRLKTSKSISQRLKPVD